MAWFGRKRGASAGPSARAEQRDAVEYLAEWVSQRHGIEVFAEPKTSLTGPTILLVAHDGEFTRRPVRSPQDAQDFAHEHGLPIYDATVVGYPQRMRDYSRRQVLLQRRADRELLGD